MPNVVDVMRTIPPVYPMLVVLGGLVGVYVLFTFNGVQSPMIEEFCRGAFYGTLAILGIGGGARVPPKPGE
jgi:hypothetical protein